MMDDDAATVMVMVLWEVEAQALRRPVAMSDLRAATTRPTHRDRDS